MSIKQTQKFMLQMPRPGPKNFLTPNKRKAPHSPAFIYVLFYLQGWAKTQTGSFINFSSCLFCKSRADLGTTGFLASSSSSFFGLFLLAVLTTTSILNITMIVDSSQSPLFPNQAEAPNSKEVNKAATATITTLGTV